jgi:transposase
MDNANTTCPPPIPEAITSLVIEFLQLFVCATLAKRIVFLLLNAAGMGAAMAGKLCGVCQKTAKKHSKMAGSGRAAELLEVGGGGRKALLADVESAIVSEVETNNYYTLKQAAGMAFEKAGVKVSLGAIRRLFSKHGIKRHMSAPLPAKADPVGQGVLFDTVLSELVAMANEGMVTLYFMDASHFVLGGGFLGSIWGKARRFVLAFSGRQRLQCLRGFGLCNQRACHCLQQHIYHKHPSGQALRENQPAKPVCPCLRCPGQSRLPEMRFCHGQGKRAGHQPCFPARIQPKPELGREGMETGKK